MDKRYFIIDSDFKYLCDFLYKYFKITKDIGIFVVVGIGYELICITDILVDFLGGNSYILMIVCVSLVDFNMEEILNILRYADRVRKIKNKFVINRDLQVVEIYRFK